MTYTTSAALLTLLALPFALQAQEPAPTAPAPRSVTLTYELPVDALQRRLQQDPSRDLEQVLAETVRTMQARLGAYGEVTRHAASGFTVRVPNATDEDLARIERRVAMAGHLEMWIVASSDYQPMDLGLAAERLRLERWLEDGGRERVLADPRAIAAAPRREGSNIRWVPHVITSDDGRWRHSLAMLGRKRGGIVPLFTAADWNDGLVPEAMAEDEVPRLVELVPLNLHAPAFSDRDLDAEKVHMALAHDGAPAIHYALLAARQQAYSDWTERFTGSSCAIVLDGELLSAPVFMGRIPGRGILTGFRDAAQARRLVQLLSSDGLPIAPQLVSRK